MELTETSYRVRLDQFEGPLDLLLHLIKKNEINIYDIPISLITAQYLEYLSLMKSLNLAVAGDFLVMAATLVQIKAKMLLPTEEPETDEDAGPDPREELVRQLLEYKRFKEAAGELDSRERLWREVFGKEPAPPPTASVHQLMLDQVTLFDLVDALNGLMSRMPARHLMEVIPEHLTVRDRMNAIIEQLEGREAMTFQALFESSPHRLLAIVTFLALLELIRIKVVRVFQAEAFGPILVSRAYALVTQDDDMDLDSERVSGSQEDWNDGYATER